ncbi:MAG: c-type cytochrome [Parahaliea sp.]
MKVSRHLVVRLTAVLALLWWPPLCGAPLESGPAATTDAQQAAEPTALVGDVERGRLVFGPCRACHYPDPAMGHNNGPNLYRIFGKVAGKQPGFADYSDTFRNAGFVWTPRLLEVWLANPRGMIPDTTMMSLGVPDPQRRADLIAYLKVATVRAAPTTYKDDDNSDDSD